MGGDGTAQSVPFYRNALKKSKDFIGHKKGPAWVQGLLNATNK
jgi:hypothetical protein